MNRTATFLKGTLHCEQSILLSIGYVVKEQSLCSSNESFCQG